MTQTAGLSGESLALLVSPKAHAEETALQAVFSTLRREAPLARVELDGCDPFVAVTRHADILEASRLNDRLLSGARPTTFTTRAADAQVRSITGGSPHLVRSLVQMDAPDHFKHRALTQAWFMPGNLRALEGRIREIAREFVGRMADMDGRCDFARDVAVSYPLRVIMEILGVPEADEPRMLRLTQELFGAADPELSRDGEAQTAGPEAAVAALGAVVSDFFAYFNALTEDRRRSPRGDVASVIANGVLDGEPISAFEAMSYYVIIAAAGHDTTSSSTAGAVWALAERPEVFRRVRDDPARLPGLVEEAIRWTTPVRHFMRSALVDVELPSGPVRSGEWLMLCYPSGNRDEAVFEAPFEFRPERSPNRHLAFGYGAHLCLGQHLARMEMRILFEELLPRLRRLELAGPPERSQGMFVNGPKRLPVAYAFV